MMKMTNGRRVWVGVLALAVALAMFSGCKKKTKAPDARVKVTKGAKAPARGATPARTTKAAKAAPQGKVKDVVCGMTIEAKTAPHKHTHDGKTYYFCNKGCFDKFTKEPNKYAKK